MRCCCYPLGAREGGGPASCKRISNLGRGGKSVAPGYRGGLHLPAGGLLLGAVTFSDCNDARQRPVRLAWRSFPRACWCVGISSGVKTAGTLRTQRHRAGGIVAGGGRRQFTPRRSYLPLRLPPRRFCLPVASLARKGGGCVAGDSHLSLQRLACTNIFFCVLR